MSDNGYTPITLDDLGVVPVEILFKTAYGREIQMRVKLLTCAQWTEIGASVPTPPRPPQENPATMRVWQEHVAKAEDERGYRRVIFAVEQGGNPIPGTTAAEKVENWRRSVDQGVHNSIMRFLFNAAMGDKASVEADADRFHADDGVNPENL